MGSKIQKSTKVTPGVNLNLNTNRASVTAGTKEARCTVNTNGTKTASETTPTTKTAPSKGSSKKKGCGTYLLWILIICLALAASAFLWIPGIAAIIVFAVKKGKTRKRNLLISIGITLVSFFIFGGCMSASSTRLTDIKVEWTASEYDISDTAEITISPVPSTAKIETLTLSKNSIASLKYKDGKAIVSFKATGSDDLYFTANKNIDSDPNSITVTDKEAERIAQEQAEAERIAQEQAEAERIAQEQAEAERIAQEQAEAERIAQEQAEAERIAQEQAQAEAAAQAKAAQQQAQGNMVWIPRTGAKYHSNSSCSNMKNPTQVTLSEAQAYGYEPCKKCY